MMIENPEKRMPASQSELTCRMDWRPPRALVRAAFAPPFDADGVGRFGTAVSEAGADLGAAGFAAEGFAAPADAPFGVAAERPEPVPGPVLAEPAAPLARGGVGRRAFIVALLSRPEDDRRERPPGRSRLDVS
ncbi:MULTISPECIES: hypothetical protein [unclassified Agromyces]|uniref:hypothetical protein n=1 Tax=unclassified Agromyces TaxID=2639701 RepID=UPI0030144B65